jgi:hypothetical protein
MLKLRQLILSLIIAASLGLLINIPTTQAYQLINNSDPHYTDGSYGLNDVENFGINVASIILSLVGSLSLLMFIYGGIMFLISGGSQDKIKHGKDAIKAAVIGLIITFSSVLIIKMFLGGLGIENWSPSINHGAIPANNASSNSTTNNTATTNN